MAHQLHYVTERNWVSMLTPILSISGDLILM